MWMLRVSCELRLRDHVEFTTKWREVVYHAYPLENYCSCRRFFTRIPKGSGNPRASVLNCLMLQMSGVWDVITLFSQRSVALGHLSLLPSVLPTKILLLISDFL